MQLSFDQWLSRLGLDLPEDYDLKNQVLFHRCQEYFAKAFQFHVLDRFDHWVRVSSPNQPDVIFDLPRLNWDEVGQISVERLFEVLNIRADQNSYKIYGYIFQVSDSEMWFIATDAPAIFGSEQMKLLKNHLQSRLCQI